MNRFKRVRITSGNQQIDKLVLKSGLKFECRFKCPSCEQEGIDCVATLESDVYYGEESELKKLKAVCGRCGEVGLFELSASYLKNWFRVEEPTVMHWTLPEDEVEFLEELTGEVMEESKKAMLKQIIKRFK